MVKKTVILFILMLLIFVFLGVFFSDEEEINNQNHVENYSSIKPSQNEEVPKRVEVPCEETYYKTAFIILEAVGDRATDEEIGALGLIKEKVSERFYNKTHGLATMDTSYPVVVLEVDDGTDLWEYYGAVNVSNLFYKTNPDEFDFLAVYTAYDSPGNMHFIGVSNYIGGTGKLKSGRGIGYSGQYGSNGTLLGIVNLREMDHNVDPESHHVVVNGFLHEIGHYWGIYIDFMSKPNGKSYSHWSRYLNMSKSVMNGRQWRENEDGTFSRIFDNDFVYGYDDFDLYLMGLIPPEEVEPIFKIITNDSIEVSQNVKGYAEEITVYDIIEVYGERKCFVCEGSERC